MTDSLASPAEIVPFSLAGFRGSVRRAAESAVHTRLLPAPEERVREGRVLRRSNARLTSRVFWEGLGPVLLKVHRARSLGERLLSLVRTGRATAEWDAAAYLAATGVPVPQPLAVGEQRRLGMLEVSFYAARFIEGIGPVHDALAAQPEDKLRALLLRLALLIRGMHDAGFDHKDLHSGNLLCGPGPGDRCRLIVADLHRCEWGASVSDRARRRGIAQWLHSLSGDLGPGGRMRWIASYLGDAERSTVRRWFGHIERRIRRMERTRRLSRGKRCFKESTVYTRDIGPGWGARRRDLPTQRLEAALQDHAAAVGQADERLLKAGRRGNVSRHSDLIVKERVAPGPLARLRDACFPRRHAAGYRHAHMLGVLEVGTARPLAYVRRQGHSFTLYEDLSRFPRLDHLARDLFRRGTLLQRRGLIRDSAEWLGRLHREGIYHGDLKAVNVLVEQVGLPFRFHVIDTDRCRFSSDPVDRRRRIKNLSQLAASIPICVTRTDRLRWYRRYAQVSAIDGETADVAQDVAAQLARKIVVIDGPIE